MAAKKTAKKSATRKPGARGAAAGLSRHRDATTVKVRADPARKKRFDALLGAMHGAERTEASGFDAYWEAVGEILDADLWVLGGYETADAFLATEVKEPRRTALRNVRVARFASPAEEAKYGTTLLDAALSYIEASTGGPPKERLPVRFEQLRVQAERDGARKKLSLDDATVEEVRAATRARAPRRVSEEGAALGRRRRSLRRSER